MKVTTFAGNSYWMYDGFEPAKVSSSYAKPTTNWGGAEGRFHDVLYVKSGYIYFFTNQTFYHYNYATLLVRGNDTNCAVRELNK
jgi:matrix metalloproteinase-14 (membrane-inserted)